MLAYIFVFFCAVLPITFAKSAPLSGESIYNLKSEWTSQGGKAIKLSDLKGKPLLLAMAYTSCKASCPLIIEQMKKIENKISAKTSHIYSFAIFSFDSERDLPAKLKAYAEKRKIDLTHWTLYHGDQKAVRELAAVLGIRYKRSSNGDFNHSNVITLIDSEGLIQYQQMGLDQDSSGLIEKMLSLINISNNHDTGTSVSPVH